MSLEDTPLRVNTEEYYEHANHIFRTRIPQ